MNRPASAFPPLRSFARLWCVAGVLAVLISAALPARAQWISSDRVGDTAYFLFASPPRIERYDLAARSWMAAVELPSTYGVPTSGRVDSDGIYVTYAKRSIYRHDLSGGSTTHLMNCEKDVRALLSDGSRLFANQSDILFAKFLSIDKGTGSIIGTFETYMDGVKGASIAPSIRKIFARSFGVSPSDIAYFSYDNTGHFLNGDDGPYHGAYPDATRTWVFPSETRVVDSSGTIYTTDALEYAGSLGTKVDDIQFPENSGPIVVSGSAMTAYTNNLLPAGSATLPFAPTAFYLNAADAVIFGSDAQEPNGIRTQAVVLSSLGTPTVPPAVDPANLAYVPDNVFAAKDGTLLLVSKIHKSVFRWSPETQGYLTTIPLANPPEYSAYSKTADVIYLADQKGMVRSVDLNASTPVEAPFAILPTAPLGLAVAGEYVFTADSSGAWCTHRTFNSAGLQISARDWNYYSKEYIWSDAAGKMYFFRDDVSPNDLQSEQVDANGVLGEEADSPLHEDGPFGHPIRVSPDGGMVILGSGAIFNGATLAVLPIALPTAVKDIVWHGGNIKTIRTVSGNAKLESWTGPTLGPGAFRKIPGKALRLLALDEARTVAVCVSAQGRPLFQVMNGNFEIVPPTSLATPAGLAITTPSAGRLLLEWSAVDGALEYVVRRKPDGSNKWEVLGHTGNGRPRLEFDVIASGTTFDYQVVATHGDLSSAPSAALENVVSGPPLPPGSFALKSISVDKAKLAWRDGALEDGYRLEFRKGGEAWKSAGFPAEDAASASIGRLDSSSQYRFRLAARNPLGLSNWVYVEGTTGEGQGEISVLFENHARELTDREGFFDLGPAMVGTKGPTSVRLVIRNVAKTELRNVSVKMTGSLAGDFKISNLRGTTIGSGKSAEIEIRFTPRGAGRRGAVLKIFSSDANESPFEILLTGLGVGRSGGETAPRSEASQHFNGLREFARWAGGAEAGEAAAFEEDVVAVPVEH